MTIRALNKSKILNRISVDVNENTNYGKIIARVLFYFVPVRANRSVLYRTDRAFGLARISEESFHKTAYLKVGRKKYQISN